MLRQLLRVSVDQRFHDLRRRFVAQLLLEIFRPQLLSPEVLGLCDGGRPARVLAIEGIAVVTGEVEGRPVQLVGVVGRPLRQPFEVAREDRLGRAGIADAARGLRQRGPIDGEPVRVRLQKEGPRPIQSVEVAIQDRAGQMVVEGVVRQLGMLEQAGREARDVGVGHGRIDHGVGRLSSEARSCHHDREPDGRQRLDDAGWMFHGLRIETLSNT